MTKLPNAIGRGLLAGLAGTAAMPVSSTLEMRLRGRAASGAPANATAKVLGIDGFVDEVAIDVWHHVVYAAATGIVYVALG